MIFENDDPLSRHMDANVIAAVSVSLVSAAQSGLLGALTDSPQSADGLATTVGVDSTAATRVLEVLARARVVEREAGGYRIGPLLEAASRGGGVEFATRLWSAVPAYLQTGRGVHFHGRSGDRQQKYRSIVGALGRLFAEPAQRLAEARAVPGEGRVLDVGAGSGVWSLAMLRANPAAHATALDLERVLPIFEEFARESGVAERTAVFAADYHERMPERAFDRVVLANVLHLEAPPDAAALAKRACECVAPGGDVVVVDALSDGTAASELRVAAYALHLGTRTGVGRPHPEAEIRSWLRAAGFERSERVPLDKVGMVAALVSTRE